MRRILIINPGVQPELQKTVVTLKSSGFNVKYATASSFGEEYESRFFIGVGSMAKSLNRVFKRRVMDFSDDLVIRYGFSLELVSYLLFRLFGKHFRPVRNFYFYLRLLFYVLWWKPEIFIFQDAIPYIYRRLRVIRLGIKVLVVSTATPMYFESVFAAEKSNNYEWSKFFHAKGFTKRKQIKYLRDVNFANYVVTPSNFVARDLGKYVKREKLRVIRLGHDLQSLGAVPMSSGDLRDAELRGLKVIFVGQLSQRKGISYLLEGFFSAKIPNDSVLTLVGTSVLGSGDFILKKYKSPRLRLEGHVSRSELGDILGKHDLFIMPSLIEGFCLSAVEALGTGIPVAVTDVVLDNLITHNFNGFVIDRISAASISNLLESVFSDKAKLINIGREGRELALNYTWKTYQEAFIQFIKEICTPT